MLVEHEGVKLLTDPGSFTEGKTDEVCGVHAVLITHEHQDHFHLPSLAILLRNNPSTEIVCNSSMQKLLQAEDIPCTVVGDGQSADVRGIKVEGLGREHAEIYGTMGLVENTGYFIADRFYFPGDAFFNPGKKVDVLALPTWGPWMKMKEAINFAKKIKARTAFGVHDGMLVPEFRGFIHQALKTLVPGTEFVELKDGEMRKF